MADIEVGLAESRDVLEKAWLEMVSVLVEKVGLYKYVAEEDWVETIGHRYRRIKRR